MAELLCRFPEASDSAVAMSFQDLASSRHVSCMPIGTSGCGMAGLAGLAGLDGLDGLGGWTYRSTRSPVRHSSREGK